MDDADLIFGLISAFDQPEYWKITEVNQTVQGGCNLLNEKSQALQNLTLEQALVEKMRVGDVIFKILFQDSLLPTDWKANELKATFGKWIKTIKEISRPYWEKIYQ